MKDIEYAYELMAKIGHKPISELSPNEGAAEYAARFSSEEGRGFHIGVPDGRTAIPLALTIEAARCMCATSHLDKAPLLLQTALRILEKENPMITGRLKSAAEIIDELYAGRPNNG